MSGRERERRSDCEKGKREETEGEEVEIERFDAVCSVTNIHSLFTSNSRGTMLQ